MKPLTAKMICQAWLDTVNHHSLHNKDTVTPTIRHITFFLMRLQFLQENS